MVFLPIYTFIQNRLHIAKHDLYYIPIIYGSTLLPFPLTTYTLDFRYKTGLMEAPDKAEPLLRQLT